MGGHGTIKSEATKPQALTWSLESRGRPDREGQGKGWILGRILWSSRWRALRVIISVSYVRTSSSSLSRRIFHRHSTLNAQNRGLRGVVLNHRGRWGRQKRHAAE